MIRIAKVMNGNELYCKGYELTRWRRAAKAMHGVELIGKGIVSMRNDQQ